jgi:pilus assembly protein CpaB
MNKLRPAFFGLLAGLVGVVLVLLYVRRVEEEVSGGRMVEVLVTVEAIPRGKTITEQMLDTQEIPARYVDSRVIRATEKGKIVGLRATNAIPVQQNLAWSDVIVPKDDQRALSALVQPGNRAAPIRVHINDVLTLINPGDFVDIVCNCGETKDATVLLQRVLVLASGVETQARDSKDSARVRVLTVSVSLQESQLLAMAMERGKLTVLVRNPQDQRIAESPADVTSAALTDAARRKALQSPQRTASAPTAPAGPTPLKNVPMR